MDGAQLKVLEPFEAFGVAYDKGAAFDLEDTKAWPKGTLKRRIENGFLGFDEDAVEEEEQVEDPDEAAVVKAASRAGRRSFALPKADKDEATGKPDKGAEQ